MKKKLLSFVMSVVMMISIFPVAVGAAQSNDTDETGYVAVEVDNNLTRFELTDKNFDTNTVRSFDFTPKTTGNYGFY